VQFGVGVELGVGCSDRDRQGAERAFVLELGQLAGEYKGEGATRFIIIIIIVIGKYTISFMQGIYTHIPQTNHVPKEYNVAAILSLRGYLWKAKPWSSA
jgi:hypothetical protein